MKRTLFLVLIAAVGAVVLRTYIIEGIYVASGSMEPTLNTGTFLFMDKITMRLRPLKRGDIIVFPSPEGVDKDLIKRVIAIPGESIELKDKKVYINGILLKENYTQYTRANEKLEGDNLGPLNVPAGMVFAMGDNRDESGDSRDWIVPGTKNHIYFVPIESIKGRILQLS